MRLGGTSGNGTGTGNQATPVTGDKGIAEIIKGLKGDVQVESVPELGILILRGGQSDVAAVMNVIREIERPSRRDGPQAPSLNVAVRQFRFVCQAAQRSLQGHLGHADRRRRGRQADDPDFLRGQAERRARPRAAGRHAWGAQAAQELDQPVNPELEFQVFRLRYGYAAQVAASVTEFYKSPEGAGHHSERVCRSRINSLIVQARPRDLVEVGRLIEKLDGPTASQATIKVFPLQNGDATSIQRLLETLFGTAGSAARSPEPANAEAGTETAAPTSCGSRWTCAPTASSPWARPTPCRAVEAVMTRLDNSDVHQRQTEVIRLKNNAADNVARAITDFVRSQRELQQIDPELLSNVELLEREVFVVSEPISNSLL